MSLIWWIALGLAAVVLLPVAGLYLFIAVVMPPDPNEDDRLDD